MARTSTASIKGLRELGEALQAKGEQMVKSTSKAATGVAAGLVYASAVARVPVETGLLKSQVITKRIPPGQASSLGVTSMHIVTVRQGRKRRKAGKETQSAPHAHLIEHGTVKMAPQPFLRPALDENVSAATDAMAQVVRNGVLK